MTSSSPTTARTRSPRSTSSGRRPFRPAGVAKAPPGGRTGACCARGPRRVRPFALPARLSARLPAENACCVCRRSLPAPAAAEATLPAGAGPVGAGKRGAAKRKDSGAAGTASGAASREAAAASLPRRKVSVSRERGHRRRGAQEEGCSPDTRAAAAAGPEDRVQSDAATPPKEGLDEDTGQSHKSWRLGDAVVAVEASGWSLVLFRVL